MVLYGGVMYCGGATDSAFLLWCYLGGCVLLWWCCVYCHGGVTISNNCRSGVTITLCVSSVVLYALSVMMVLFQIG